MTLEDATDGGSVRELNPGPHTFEARIIPLDQETTCLTVQLLYVHIKCEFDENCYI